MCENPKKDRHRLARVIYMPRNVEEAHRALIAQMCDTTSFVNAHSVAATARVFRNIYIKQGPPLALVDEWDLPAPRVPPVAVVYCTTDRLLRWAGTRAARDAQIEAARRELHEHVQRMDAYFKAQLEQEEAT